MKEDHLWPKDVVELQLELYDLVDPILVSASRSGLMEIMHPISAIKVVLNFQYRASVLCLIQIDLCFIS